MTVVQLTLPDQLRQAIDRQIAAGHAIDEADFLLRAGQLIAEHLDARDEIAAMVARADADIAAGNYVTVTSSEQSMGLHEARMDRLRARLEQDSPSR